jgi:fructokinase
VDTDVNGAALAESLWGAGSGHDVVLYFTVGTGIGGGAVIHGRTLRGEGHPEMGHIRLPRHPDDMDFAGTCPFHGCCLEGLASGPAILARWGKSLSELGADHPGHQIIAWYLAHTAVTMQAIFEPGRIVFGGGVMATPGLIERATQQASQLGGGYFRSDALQSIVRPGLGDNAGLLGALAVALSSTS